MTPGPSSATRKDGRAAGAGAPADVDRLARVVADADPDRYLAVHLPVADPAPRLDPAAGRTDHLFWWIDRDGGRIHAQGSAARVVGSGPDRFREVRDRAAALASRLDVHGAGPAPRLVGGFSFAPGAADAAPWEGFGDARFVLPALTWSRDAGGARLTVCLSPEQLRSPERREGAVRRVAAALERAPGNGPQPPSGPPGGVILPPGRAERQSEYEALVREALAEIGGTDTGKIVVARRVQLDFREPPALPPLLARLTDAPSTFRFAVAVDGRVFLGATPERLIAVAGGRALTEALAGTAASSASDARDNGEPLERREKELHEHELVVRTIADALDPLCAELDHDPTPTVRTAGPVRHLATRFDCRVEGDVHVLELVERLHPTSAVGGWPTAPALDWLGRHEGNGRGWYASPVGWFDTEGEGEFAVALRSGVLDGTALHLFAGSGIVAGSDPGAEYEETRLKLRALPQALGLL